MSRPILLTRDEGLPPRQSPGIAFISGEGFTCAVSCRSSTDALAAVEAVQAILGVNEIPKPSLIIKHPIGHRDLCALICRAESRAPSWIQNRSMRWDPAGVFHWQMANTGDYFKSQEALLSQPIDGFYLGVGGSIRCEKKTNKATSLLILGDWNRENA